MGDTAAEQLGEEVERLRASRARLVATADAERRELERDIHDGVQQQLVALAVRLQLLGQACEADPAASALVEEIRSDLRDALAEVRRLCERTYPLILGSRGLAVALRAAAGTAGVPVRVVVESEHAWSADLTAAVYRCCLTALENVAAHAGPDARATIAIRDEDGALVFEVADDGIGFPAGTPAGTGLDLIEARVSALGGRLAVSSTPGDGTRLVGSIPSGAPGPDGAHSTSAR
jgi:signal transduction histidine kinase